MTTKIDELVNRFLTWPVPADVYPDGTPGQPGRTGTNLLTAQQAKDMLTHVLGDVLAEAAKSERRAITFGDIVQSQVIAMRAAVVAAKLEGMDVGMQWIANFAVSTTFPPMANNLGLGISYAIYASMALLSFFFVLSFVRETRGRELEEM